MKKLRAVGAGVGAADGKAFWSSLGGKHIPERGDPCSDVGRPAGAHHQRQPKARSGEEQLRKSLMSSSTPPDTSSPLLRLRESMAFFRVYGRDLLRFFTLLYLPVVIVSLVLPQNSGQGAGFPGVAFILNFFYQPIYTGALIYQLAQIEAGQPWTVREGFIVGVRLWDKLLLVNVVSLALTLTGLMAFIIPGLIVYARLALAEYRVVLAGDSPKAALQNSFRMTRPFTLPIIACTAVLFGIFLSAQIVIEGLASALAMPLLLPEALNILLSLVLMVLLTILLFRFYGLADQTGDSLSS